MQMRGPTRLGIVRLIEADGIILGSQEICLDEWVNLCISINIHVISVAYIIWNLGIKPGSRYWLLSYTLCTQGVLFS